VLRFRSHAPFQPWTPIVRLHLYDVTSRRLPPIGQGRYHICQMCLPPRVRLSLYLILARIILSYRHSIGCSQAHLTQSARAAMSN